MDGKVRVADCGAGLLWLVAAWLLVRSSVDTELTAMRAWGVTVAVAAAAASVCAFVSCAATKVLRAIHRAQLEDLMKVER